MGAQWRWGATALCCAAVLAAAGCARESAPQANEPEVSETRGIEEGFRAVKPNPADFGPPATAEQRAFFEGDFEAVGNEPDWKLTVLDDFVAFERVGLSEVIGLPNPREIRANGAIVEAEPLTVILRAGACEHQSGEIFPYLATVQFEDIAYEGCARRADGGAGATPEWTAILPELVPAIDACALRVEAKPALVTVGYVIADNTVNVRFRAADGGRYECAATRDGEVTAFDTISDRNVMRSEGDPSFARGAEPPPADPCQDVKPFVGPDGAQLGWTVRRTC